MYIERELRRRYSKRQNLSIAFVENFDRPLVAIGTILSGSQPEIGRIFASKEACGTLVSNPFDQDIHQQNDMAIPEDTTRGQEAGNIIDWIVHIVSFARTCVCRSHY